MSTPTLQRWAAFATDPTGGNPAGVRIGPELPLSERMQQIAAEVGYSETAFVSPTSSIDEWTIRHYSPEIQVDFCGHATIAAAAALLTSPTWNSDHAAIG